MITVADTSEEAWKKLSLLEVDAKVVQFDEEMLAEKAKEITLNLLGKLMIDGTLG